MIASPGNGETLYVKGNYTAPEFIAGKVFYAGQSLITDIEIRLDILSGIQKVASLVTHPSGNGDYNFNVAINPESPPPYLSRPGTRTCLVCHGDFLPEAGLPKGEVRIVVTATAPDGKSASDERWLRIDTSGEVVIPVQVVDELTKKPLAGLRKHQRSCMNGGIVLIALFQMQMEMLSSIWKHCLRQLQSIASAFTLKSTMGRYIPVESLFK